MTTATATCKRPEADATGGPPAGAAAPPPLRAVMLLKPDAKSWTVKEQIVDDAASGLTIQFEVMPEGEARLRLFGENLPVGNREFIFDRDGAEADTSNILRP